MNTDGTPYTGDARPGGPAAVRELAGLTITKVSVSDFDNNAYLLRCRRTGEQLLIDAAAEPDRLLTLAGGGLATVVTTHRHWDHVRALADVAAATGARSLAHADDAAHIPGPPEPLADGDRVPVGECALEVIHLRGHTPGALALAYRDPASGRAHLFTGDSLFPGGPGRTTSAGDFATLMDDLETKVFGRFPDDTWFYPGHGRDSTLGAERPQLPHWRSRGW